MNRIIVGDKSYDGAYNITSGTQSSSKSLLSNVLEIDALDFDIVTEDSSILNAEGSRLVYYHNETQRSIAYVQTVKWTGYNTYHVYATSAIRLLDGLTHVGGIYTGQTVGQLVKEICGPIPVYIKTSLVDVKLYGWLPYVRPPEKSARDNLAQVLFAIGASLGTDLDGVLRIEPLWDGVSGVIEQRRVDIGGKVEHESPITAVSVLEHQYIEGEETQELFNGTSAQNDPIIFTEPMHSLSATGFTILESGANYAIVSAGSGVLTGKKYIHTTREVVASVSAANIENVQTYKEGTLVSLVNSQAVATRLADYHRCQDTITEPVITGAEKPGDVVLIYHPYSREMVRACVSRANTTMSATLKSELTALVGFVPPNTAGVYDTVEVITEDTVWQEPEGATTARIVLIGGSAGGASGTGGKPGTINNSGGEGGTGGAAGSGGKIYEFSIDLAGKTHNIKIGLGGAGGIYAESGSNPGSPGTATTFDAYTSDMGTASETGYLDPINQTTYATPGKAGVDGGKGGKGGKSTSSDSEAGESVGEYSGGRPGSWQRIATDTGYAYAHGAGGGGAAMGANGGRGGSGYINSTASGMGGDGGTGASATIVPDKPKTRGCGGDGGHAGGGGGSPGIATGFSENNWNGFGGPGGSGNNGGPGADGVALIFYARTKPIAEGALVDRNRHWVLDRLGRRVIK